MKATTKIKREMITKKILNDARWTTRALLAIYKRQTVEEQEFKTTKEHNAVGFSKYDAEILTSIAEQLINRGSISSKQLEVVRKRIIKYVGQLVKIAEGGN